MKNLVKKKSFFFLHCILLITKLKVFQETTSFNLIVLFNIANTDLAHKLHNFPIHWHLIYHSYNIGISVNRHLIIIESFSVPAKRLDEGKNSVKFVENIFISEIYINDNE